MANNVIAAASQAFAHPKYNVQALQGIVGTTMPAEVVSGSSRVYEIRPK